MNIEEDLMLTLVSIKPDFKKEKLEPRNIPISKQNVLDFYMKSLAYNTLQFTHLL